jgi:hypothetical protein
MTDCTPTPDHDLIEITKQLEATIAALVPNHLTLDGARILRRLTRTLTNGPATRFTPYRGDDGITSELTPADTGTWLVHTSNGAHLIDLDNHTVTDINRPHITPRRFTELASCKLGSNLILRQSEDGKASVQYTDVSAIERWPRAARTFP